jgi:hypothetical protein
MALSGPRLYSAINGPRDKDGAERFAMKTVLANGKIGEVA